MEVVEPVVDELRDVVVDARLGGLERGAAVDLVHAACGLAADLVDEDDADERQHRGDDDHEHHAEALLLRETTPDAHDSPRMVTLDL